MQCVFCFADLGDYSSEENSVLATQYYVWSLVGVYCPPEGAAITLYTGQWDCGEAEVKVHLQSVEDTVPERNSSQTFQGK